MRNMRYVLALPVVIVAAIPAALVLWIACLILKPEEWLFDKDTDI